MSTNFAKTLVWKQDYDVKLWRRKQRTTNTNDYPMPLNEPPHKIFLRTPLLCVTAKTNKRQPKISQTTPSKCPVAVWSVLPLCCEQNPQNLPWKNPRHAERSKKVKTELEMHATGTCTWNLTKFAYLHHIFSKFKSIFKHTDNYTSRLAANQMYEVT